jgi:hypothetical protein
MRNQEQQFGYDFEMGRFKARLALLGYCGLCLIPFFLLAVLGVLWVRPH